MYCRSIVDRGLAREIVSQYSKREKANQRKMLILTCLPEKVAMYEKNGTERQRHFWFFLGRRRMA